MIEGLYTVTNDPVVAAFTQIGFIVTMIAICAAGVCCEAVKWWRR